MSEEEVVTSQEHLDGGYEHGEDQRSDRNWADEDNSDSRRDRHEDYAASSGATEKQPEHRNLHVTLLSFETTDESLRKAFEVFGTIENTSIVRDPVSKMSRGYGFVKYVSAVDCAKALAAMNGADVDGRAIKVEYSRRQAPHEKTPGRYMGNPNLSSKYPRDRDGGRSGGGGHGGGGYDRRDHHDYAHDYRGGGGGGGYRDDYRRGGYDDRGHGSYRDDRGHRDMPAMSGGGRYDDRGGYGGGGHRYDSAGGYPPSSSRYDDRAPPRSGGYDDRAPRGGYDDRPRYDDRRGAGPPPGYYDYRDDRRNSYSSQGARPAGGASRGGSDRY